MTSRMHFYRRRGTTAWVAVTEPARRRMEQAWVAPFYEFRAGLSRNQREGKYVRSFTAWVKRRGKWQRRRIYRRFHAEP